MPSARVPSVRTESGPGCNRRLVPAPCNTSPFGTGDESRHSASLGTARRGADTGTPSSVQRRRAGSGPPRLAQPSMLAATSWPLPGRRGTHAHSMNSPLRESKSRCLFIQPAASTSRRPKDERARRECTWERAGKQPYLSATVLSLPLQRSLSKLERKIR